MFASDIPTVTVTNSIGQSGPVASPTLKSPRAAKFAEATAIVSPVDTRKSTNPFKDPPTNHYMPQPQVADIGFGYVGKRASYDSVEIEETDEKYLAPMTPKTPLKSAMKSPGAAPRNLEAMLSPTFREEQVLEKTEKMTDKEQVRDLKSKMRVRVAKIFLRFINFGCSLIVLSMLATTFTIFNATKSIPPRNNLPPWAFNTKTWPQITLICIASLSLFTSLVIFYGYWRGGHRRAEKVAVYYTTITTAFFVFSIVMWGIGAFVLNQSRANGHGKDLWGWSCGQNTRFNLFKDDISFALVCRLQNWSLMCCIIEVVVEVIAVLIYGITFYRYYTKRRLRKTMASRDKARSDLYLAQLKLQSAPNTPGLPGGLLSPRDGAWQPPQGYDSYNQDRKMEMGEAGVEEEGVQFVIVRDQKLAAPAPFALKAPPTKRARGENEKSPTDSTNMDQIINEHVPAAPGEAQYAAVAIPGAYQPNSPGFSQSFDFYLP